MHTRKLFAALLTAAFAAAVAVPVLADETEPIKISGLVDWYFLHNFNNPPSSANPGAPLRAFDIKHSQFSLSLAEVNISRAVSQKSPFGFTATLTLGKTADIVHLTEPGGTQNLVKLSNDTIYKYAQQLYGSYLVGNTTVDFGKFVTHHGMEVIESSSNDNYSRSLLFTFAIPFYHMGIRTTTPLGSKTTLGFRLVNGWNNVEDDNGGKSLGLQLNLKPSPTTNLILNYMGGDESAGALLSSNLNVQLLDIVGIWNVDSKTKLGFNIDYADASKSGTTGGHWSGWALYARRQLTDSSAAALRWETFQDSNGLRTGTAQNVSSFTATYEYSVKGNLLHRLEYRRDHAGTAAFFGGRDQDTITFGQVIKF